jgi:hypothetical protein
MSYSSNTTTTTTTTTTKCTGDLQAFQKPRKIALGLSGYQYPKLVPNSQ